MPKEAAPITKNWDNRIVAYGEETPDQLLANPQNWRVHSKNQQIAMAGVLDDIGFIAPVIVNRQTGHLVDGHLRVSLALRYDVPKIPVVYVDISEQEEREALATFDPITGMAASDMAMLENLVKDIGTVNDTTRLLLGEIVNEANKKAVKAILDPIQGYEATVLPPDQPNALPRSTANLSQADDEITDMLAQSSTDDGERNEFGKKVFPAMFSDNEWGVPTLDVTAQCLRVPTLVERWGRVARHGTRMPGLWHFYTDDYKFLGVWKDPDVVVRSGALAAVEPNFSTGTNFAKAEVLYNIWQKRWLASYWQSQGIDIVVDLNVEPIFADIALIGVPEGWRSYAIRLHATDGYGLENVLMWEKLAKERAGTDDIQFLVFATKTKDSDRLCAERGWTLLKMDSHIKGTAL